MTGNEFKMTEPQILRILGTDIRSATSKYTYYHDRWLYVARLGELLSTVNNVRCNAQIIYSNIQPILNSGKTDTQVISDTLQIAISARKALDFPERCAPVVIFEDDRDNELDKKHREMYNTLILITQTLLLLKSSTSKVLIIDRVKDVIQDLYTIIECVTFLDTRAHAYLKSIVKDDNHE